MSKWGRTIAGTGRGGIDLFRLAPWIPALVIVPEFAQHVVEISIGMFASLDQARALSADPRRMAFGAAKIAGLLLAFLAAARFGGTHARGEPFWRAPWRPVRFVLALAGFLLIPLTAQPVRLLSPAVGSVVGLLLTVGTLPLIYIFVAALAGESDVSVRRAYTVGWRNVLLLLTLLVLAFAPAQALHMALHRLALGAPTAAVWALMTADALVVGLLAALVGTAFWRGYAAAFR